VLEKFSFDSKVEKQLDSTVEWMLSTDEISSDFVSKPKQSFEFTVEWLASTSDPHFVEWLASTSDPHFESMIASFSFASTDKCNSMVELFTSTGRDFDSTIKFNASTGEEYCELFACGTEVALDRKQVGFTPSSLFSRDQQAAVDSLLIEACLPGTSLLLNALRKK
jgi:hypothetical protein